MSRKTVNSYQHLGEISNKLYLSAGTVQFSIGKNLTDAFVDVRVIFGSVGEPIAKRNCFGWYVMGQFTDRAEQTTAINSVNVETVSALEDMKKLLIQDMLGVKPTELCTCRDNDKFKFINDKFKFIKSIPDSTQIVDGRVHVRMPW